MTEQTNPYRLADAATGVIAPARPSTLVAPNGPRCVDSNVWLSPVRHLVEAGTGIVAARYR
jgi:hypothetical protein